MNQIFFQIMTNIKYYEMRAFLKFGKSVLFFTIQQA